MTYSLPGWFPVSFHEPAFLENGCGAEGQGFFGQRFRRPEGSRGAASSSCVYNVRLWTLAIQDKRENSCTFCYIYVTNVQDMDTCLQGHVHTVPLGSETFWLLFYPPCTCMDCFSLCFTALYCLTFENNLFYFICTKISNMNNSPLEVPFIKLWKANVSKQLKTFHFKPPPHPT